MLTNVRSGHVRSAPVQNQEPLVWETIIVPVGSIGISRRAIYALRFLIRNDVIVHGLPTPVVVTNEAVRLQVFNEFPDFLVRNSVMPHLPCHRQKRESESGRSSSTIPVIAVRYNLSFCSTCSVERGITAVNRIMYIEHGIVEPGQQAVSTEGIAVCLDNISYAGFRCSCNCRWLSRCSTGRSRSGACCQKPVFHLCGFLRRRPSFYN